MLINASKLKYINAETYYTAVNKASVLPPGLK